MMRVCAIRFRRPISYHFYSNFRQASSSTIELPEFRQTYESQNRNWKGWFPKHMYGGLQHMQAKLRNIDMVIEVHDARIPLSGRNPKFQESLYAIRPHILVLNKVDLIDKKHIPKVNEILLAQGVKHIFWTDCKERKKKLYTTLNEMDQVILDTLQQAPRYNREKRTEYMLMVIGIPNTGKSSFINALRGHFLGKKDSAPVENRPGVTKVVMEKIKIHETPKTYILDTPGIIDPFVRDIEVGMKMALCRCLHDHNVGEIHIADYLLYYCNKYRKFDYVKLLELDGPKDDILELLNEICLKHSIVKKVMLPGMGRAERPNFEHAAMKFVSLFRNKKLGDQFLDLEMVYREDQSLSSQEYLESMHVKNV